MRRFPPALITLFAICVFLILLFVIWSPFSESPSDLADRTVAPTGSNSGSAQPGLRDESADTPTGQPSSGAGFSETPSGARKPGEDFLAGLVGQIADERQQPVGGAKIAFFSEYDQENDSFVDKLREVHSGPEGFYRITLDEPGKPFLVVDALGYEVVAKRMILTESTLFARDFVLSIAAPARVWGTIRDKMSGRPLADVYVGLNFLDLGESPFGWLHYRTTKTDSEGRYEFERLRKGWRFSIMSEGPDHMVARTPMTIVDLDTDHRQDLELRRSGKVALRIVSEAGEGISEAQVSLQSPGSLPGHSDDQGFVTLKIRRDALRKLKGQFSAEGYFDRTQEIDRDDPTTMVVVLESAPSVEGVVVDASGRHVAGASVVVTSGPEGKKHLRSAKTNAEGRFAIRPRSLPVKSIRASHRGFLGSQVEIDEIPDFTRIVLDFGIGSISGRVFAEDGSPVREFGASVTRKEDNPREPSLQSQRVSEPEGRFSFENLPDGTYELLVLRNPNDQQLTLIGRVSDIEIVGGNAVTDLQVPLSFRHPESPRR